MYLQQSKYFIPAILWALFILWVSLLPSESMPKIDFFSPDKIGHLGVYCILTLLSLFGLSKTKTLNFKLLLSVFVLCSAYGILIEFLQGWLTANRQPDIADAVANTIGCLLGIWIFSRWIKK